MPFIPHTDEEISAMLAEIGVDSTEELFDEIPQSLKIDAKDLQGVPGGMPEMEVNRLLGARAATNKNKLCISTDSDLLL